MKVHKLTDNFYTRAGDLAPRAGAKTMLPGAILGNIHQKRGDFCGMHGVSGDLTGSTSTLKASTSTLKASTNTLKASTSTLKASTRTLKASTSTLKASTRTLKASTSTLKAYKALVDPYKALVEPYKASVEPYKALVDACKASVEPYDVSVDACKVPKIHAFFCRENFDAVLASGNGHKCNLNLLQRSYHVQEQPIHEGHELAAPRACAALRGGFGGA